MTKTVAITGGTGFLGQAVIRSLNAQGWRIRLLVRKVNHGLPLADHDIELVFGDLSDQPALDRLVTGADAVAHLAGAIKAKDRAAFMAVNRDGTARLAEAVARCAPTARLVHVSSLAAREPQLSDYTASKYAGEQALQTTCPDVSWVMVRPPALYGPGDTATLPVFQWAKAPFALLPNGPNARICLLHVDDAATAVAALCAGGPDHQVFELSDHHPQGYSWHTIVSQAAQTVGGTPHMLQIPAWVTKVIGSTVGLFGQLTGRVSVLSAGKAREVLHLDWSSSPDRQPPQTLWSPRFSLADGFRDTVRWYRKAQWL